MSSTLADTHAPKATPTAPDPKRRRAGQQGQAPGWVLAAALVLAAIAVPVAQALLGVQLTGRHGAHDGSFAVYTLMQFQNELAQGHGLPRWSFEGNFGLGSPIFYIYPPGAFAFAAWIGSFLPGAAAPTVIGVCGIIFRLAAITTCTLWLRRHTNLAAALAGAALYALMPYISVVNPQVRLAFAETAAAALLPLAFLAIDLGAARIARTVTWLAPAIALLTLTHLPSTVLAGGLVLPYAVIGVSRNQALRRGVGALVGVLLGLALAGATLVPALGLLSDISSAAFTAPQNLPENNLLFMHVRDSGAWVFNLAIVPPLAIALLALYPALEIGGRRAAAIAITLGLGVFLTTPTSLPLWKWFSPLATVQFPWRFLLPVSLFAAALLAMALRRVSGVFRWLVLAGGIAEAAVALLFAVAYGDHGRSAAARQAAALNDWLANEAEYIPAAAGSKGWLAAHSAGADAFRREAQARPGCAANHALRSNRTTEGVAIEVDGCVGPTALPQFYFPGWSAAADAVTLPLDPDPATGLVRVNLPPGTKTVTLTRKPLPQETAGIQVTAGSLMLWLLAVLAATYHPARAPAPSRRGSPLSPVRQRASLRK